MSPKVLKYSGAHLGCSQEITNLSESGEKLSFKLMPQSDLRKVVSDALEEFTVHDKGSSQWMLVEFE